MKRLFPTLMAAAFALGLAPQAAMAAIVTLVSKKPAGPLGNFNYTFAYTCSSGKKGQLTLTMANDNAARQTAALQASELCGE